MPELPEVETIVRGLRGGISRLEFSGIRVGLDKCLQGPRRSLARMLKGRRILGVERRGKNIILSLSGGWALFIHLGMSGKLRVVPADSPPEKHTHLIFSFRGHPRQLRFIDPRRFGRVFWERKSGDEWVSLSRLGPEPLGLSPPEFVLRALSRRREIKPLLLDQRFLAGVGNIYADESLHRAGIHPRRKSASLPEAALLSLHRAVQEVLLESIGSGGSSVRSYVDSAGASGEFQRSHRVYGREGDPCLSCGTPIVRERVGGRSSFYCPRCQPLKPGAEGKQPPVPRRPCPPVINVA